MHSILLVIEYRQSGNLKTQNNSRLEARLEALEAMEALEAKVSRVILNTFPTMPCRFNTTCRSNPILLLQVGVYVSFSIFLLCRWTIRLRVITIKEVKLIMIV